MLERFVPMREWLTPPEAVQTDIALPEPGPVVEDRQAERAIGEELDAAFDDAKRFRAALADAIETCATDVLQDIAADVLARELLLAPCDLRAIISRAIARYGNDLVRARVNPEDAPRMEAVGVPVVVDDGLRCGDAVLETHYGSIDASLGVRLDLVLSQACA